MWSEVRRTTQAGRCFGTRVWAIQQFSWCTVSLEKLLSWHSCLSFFLLFFFSFSSVFSSADSNFQTVFSPLSLSPFVLEGHSAEESPTTRHRSTRNDRQPRWTCAGRRRLLGRWMKLWSQVELLSRHRPPSTGCMRAIGDVCPKSPVLPDSPVTLHGPALATLGGGTAYEGLHVVTLYFAFTPNLPPSHCFEEPGSGLISPSTPG